MTEAYVYVVACADGSWYTGWTHDVLARIAAHNGGAPGGAKYTKTRRPVRLLWQAACENKIVAQQAEYRIKALARQQKERLVAGDATLWTRITNQLSGNWQPVPVPVEDTVPTEG